jgi:hypothetical protein
MSYYVKFNDITSMQGQTNQTIQQWGESLKQLQESIALLANQSELQGKAMTSAKSYMTEVHGTFIQTLTLLMNEYIASFLLYRDGYYQIDTHNHAGLPEDVYKGLYSDLGKSKQRFEQQLEQLTTAKLRVAGLVNYQGSSHTKTKFKYEKLMKDIKHLDESITQYEEMHARQDLQAFKELLAATKSLLAEHSSRDRSMGSYQSGAFGKLPSVQRFMVAYEQVTAQLNDRMGIIQAALERDQVRMEALHAEERTKQGLMNLVFGVLTFVAGLSALAMSGGTALPIVAPMLKIAGVGMYFLGSSNSFEGVQNIILGSIGDGKTVAVNPIRDTIFFGNAELYNHVGQVFSLTTGLFIPIAQTKSIAQGFSQFFWGTVGGLATGQVAYHGTKLLGGNEETAQLMNLFGNLVGGYKFSKIAENFSLNTVRVPKFESALEIENRVMENIKASKTARESSGFKQYVAKEYALAEEIRYKNYWNEPILKIPKGSRPNPKTYVNSEYLTKHFAEFEDGATVIQTEWAYTNYSESNGFVGVPDDNTLFVMPKKYADKVIQDSNGNINYIEEKLGFPKGYFKYGGGLVRIDIEDLSGLDLRLPSGNETGANSLWIPGGETSGGVPEAVLNTVPLDKTRVSRIGIK